MKDLDDLEVLLLVKVLLLHSLRRLEKSVKNIVVNSAASLDLVQHAQNFRACLGQSV